jgi:acyl-CoA synthetase (AMP-forming)/AMP-acid ligase II
MADSDSKVSARGMPKEADTLVGLLRRGADAVPDRVVHRFLEDGEIEAGQLTFGSLDQQARAIAAVLSAAGLTGQRALLLYLPGLEYIAAFFGCLYGGVVPVPVYPPDPSRLDRTLPRLEAIVKDAGAVALLTTASLAAMSDSLVAMAPGLAALETVATDTIPPGAADGWRPRPENQSELALLQYTSGSTGPPRGVMLSHAQVLHNLRFMRSWFDATPESVCVSWLPPYHDMGLMGCTLMPVYCRGRAWTMSPIAFLQRPQRWLEAISRYGGTICGGPTFGYELCTRRSTPEDRERLNLRSWQFALFGAEPVRHETIARFLSVFEQCGFSPAAVRPAYGLAEAALVVSGARAAGHSAPVLWVRRETLRKGRVEVAKTEQGYALVGCGGAVGDQRILIVDPQQRVRCAHDQVGEIWVQSPSATDGYWGRPEESAAACHAQLADDAEAGGFLRTGDLGFLYEGELFITGRLKDQLVVRGAKHNAEDLERTVEKSHPAVRAGSGAAFGIDTPAGQRVAVAFEIDTRRGANPQDIVDAIGRSLSAVHEIAPHVVILLKPGTVPKTSSGKVQRHAMRATYVKGIDDAIFLWQVPGESIRDGGTRG